MRLQALVFALSSCVLACSLDTGAVVDAGPDLDANPDAPGDTAIADSAPDVRDTGTVDAPPTDASPDVSVPTACPISDSDTLALYAFDAMDGADSAGAHDATFVDGSPLFASGPTDCGRSLYFENSAIHALMQIPDSPDWDLAIGSLDFYLYLASPQADDRIGVLSRDASGTANPGHLSLYLNGEGRVLVRIQAVGADHFLCSESTIPVGVWTHIGLNLGPPEVTLHIDGRSEDHEGAVAAGVRIYDCTGTVDWSIAGNDNPWIVGAHLSASSEGTADTIQNPLRDARIDNLRISSVRRDFSTFAP